MATNANWTVIFDDQLIIKKAGDAAGSGYIIDDSSFWNQSKFSNIWAIQHGTSNVSDEVEYRDETPHSSYADADLGDVSQFITRWDAAHLNQLQIDWDGDNEEGETSEEKIARLGPRPTSYTS
jgi:hypothetical protein